MDISKHMWYCVLLKKGSDNMAKRRPNGEGMIRQKKKGQWEGRIVVGHNENGKPIFRYVYAKTQKDLINKLHYKIDEFRDIELTKDSKMLLSEWLDKWLAEYMKGTMVKWSVLIAKTMNTFMLLILFIRLKILKSNFLFTTENTIIFLYVL